MSMELTVEQVRQRCAPVLFHCNSTEELGHRVQVAESRLKGFELIKQQDFAMIFLDLRMPGMDGAQLFHQKKAIKPKLSVTIITGYHDNDMMVRALAQGPFGIMNKPFGESDIVAAINISLGITKARAEH